MASSFEKLVKGTTKIKVNLGHAMLCSHWLLTYLSFQAAPPKTKYIEHILIATHSGEYGVAEVFRSLQNRLQDSTWTVVFKSLITIHLMIREGSLDVTLDFLAKHIPMLGMSSFSNSTFSICSRL
jgi:phosphatidylinositol-binding clathrin assembly protein